MKEEVRHITHMDLDAFFVSVEYLRNPDMRGRPVLIGGKSGRGVVASCSYEARKFGIYSGMPMKSALRLCPEATITKSNYEEYVKYSRLVTEIIKDKVPLFEKASIDEFYLDLTGMDRYFGCLKYSDELKKTIFKESGLTISYALASNKLVSKIATNEVKPNGQIEIPTGSEKSFLAPLSILKIPGIGKETGNKLIQMGIKTVGVLANIPVTQLINQYGPGGADLHRRANGIDESPVVSYHEQKSVSTERTFSLDTTDMEFLLRELIRMTEKIAFEIRSQNKLTGCISIKIRYSDFQTEQKQVGIPYTSSDQVLIKKVKELFNRLYSKRLPIRLIGVRLTDLITGTYQMNFFDDALKNVRLYKAIDSVKIKYGKNYLNSAGGFPGDTASKKNKRSGK